MSQPKPTLIMIHGFRGTHHGLLLIAQQLHGFSIIVPDLPGFGNGPKLDNYSLDSYVKWLNKYISAQHLTTPPVVLGHSFGSIIAAAYAQKYPHSLSRLILVNPIGAPALEGPNKILTKLAVTYYKIGAKLPPKAAYKWLAAKTVVRIMSLAMITTKDKGLKAFIYAQHDQYFSRFHSSQSVLESFTASISHNVSQFATNVTVPTLLIAGALDNITPLGKQYALVKLFPNAKLRTIDSVGHLTHYEKPTEVARYVEAFCGIKHNNSRPGPKQQPAKTPKQQLTKAPKQQPAKTQRQPASRPPRLT